VKILIMDDETLFRSGLSYLLASLDPKPELVETCDLAGAQRALRTTAIELVILDVRSGDTNGSGTLEQLRLEFPLVPLMVLSSERDPTVIHRCIEHGAMGFVTKHASHSELLGAIRLVIAGGLYLPRELLPGIGASSPEEHHPTEVAILAQLSERQREVLDLLLQGLPNKRISSELAISQNTVKSHVSAIFRALGARNRTEAVFMATRAGIKSKPRGATNPGASARV